MIPPVFPSRAEQMSDAVIHVAGLTLVVGAVPALIVLAALTRGDAAAMVGISIYGATLLADDPLLGALPHGPVRVVEGRPAPAGPFGDLPQDRRHLHALHPDFGPGLWA